MLRKLRAHMTYANVVSTIALALVLGGGTAYAAIKIGTSNIRYHAVTASKLANNSVTASKVKNSALSGSDLRNNSVTSADIRTGTLLATDFAPNQLPKGDKGDKGDPATSIFGVISQTGVPSNSKNLTGVSVNGNDYTVTINQDVSKCAAVATATGSTLGTVTAAPAAGNAQQITFSTFDAAGAGTPHAFQFAVYC
jgi:hypothetical protein